MAAAAIVGFSHSLNFSYQALILLVLLVSQYKKAIFLLKQLVPDLCTCDEPPKQHEANETAITGRGKLIKQ